jgi:hypothetical protein
VSGKCPAFDQENSSSVLYRRLRLSRGIESTATLTSSGEIAASHAFRWPRAMNWRYASNAIECMFHLALQRGRNRFVE